MKKLVLSLIAILSLNINAQAEKKSNITIIEQEFNNCSATFEIEYDNCPGTQFIKCYYHRMKILKDMQICYQKIAVNLFKEFYQLTEKEATQRFDRYANFIYDQYLFIFSETSYCKKNNCGIGLYLYSEYATTEQLYYYINKIIKSISARD